MEQGCKVNQIFFMKGLVLCSGGKVHGRRPFASPSRSDVDADVDEWITGLVRLLEVSMLDDIPTTAREKKRFG